MPTPTKNTPKLNLESLTAVEAEVPKQTRERKHADNPFTAWLAESYESGKGRSVTIPNANATEVEYLIRRASNDLGIGARVVKQENKPRKGQTTVLFQGKARKQRKSAENGDASTDA